MRLEGSLRDVGVIDVRSSLRWEFIKRAEESSDIGKRRRISSYDSTGSTKQRVPSMTNENGGRECRTKGHWGGSGVSREESHSLAYFIHVTAFPPRLLTAMEKPHACNLFELGRSSLLPPDRQALTDVPAPSSRKSRSELETFVLGISLLLSLDRLEPLALLITPSMLIWIHPNLR